MASGSPKVLPSGDPSGLPEGSPSGDHSGSRRLPSIVLAVDAKLMPECDRLSEKTELPLRHPPGGDMELVLLVPAIIIAVLIFSVSSATKREHRRVRSVHP